MGRKYFKDVREGDTLYRISMSESMLDEDGDSGLQRFIVKSTEGNAYGTVMITGKMEDGGISTFSPRSESTSHVIKERENDEINLSFIVYASTKEEAVEEATRLIYEKKRILSIIRNRISECETGLLLAEASLDAVDIDEEPSLEEFASMALC